MAKRMFLSLAVLTLAVTLPPTVHAQALSQPAKTFDTVSIRPAQPTDMRFETVTNDSVQLNDSMVFTPILMAWLPERRDSGSWTAERIQGLPDWARKTNYNMLAKVDATTAEEWKELSLQQIFDRIKPLMQLMLADRFKLKLHTAPVEMAGYALVLQKGGPKFKETSPGAELPKGVPQADGGVEVPHPRSEKTRMTLFGTSMASFANRVSFPGHPVVDQTGLTGRYDLELPGRDDWNGAMRLDASPDPTTRWQFDDLGLAIKPIKVPTVNLVIDHIEPPTPN